MKITQVLGREIFDARGYPALECEIILEDNSSVIASVPSGTSRGAAEAYELRDGGKRLMGYGLRKAIDHIEQKIAPLLVGTEPNAIETDIQLISLDGTEDKSRLGANTLLAVSMAMYRAHAYVEGIDLYQLIAQACGFESVLLPRPFFNMISGAKHAHNQLAIQEFLIVPLGAHDFRSAFESSTMVFSHLKQLLADNGKSTLIADEGSFAPTFDSQNEPLDYLVEAISRAAKDLGIKEEYFGLALDVAASHFYNKESKTYTVNKKEHSANELIAWYGELLGRYPICSIEDGLDENDWTGWQKMSAALSSRTQLVADDLTVTDKNRIAQAIELGIGNTILIKPNQVGTISETLQSVRICQENNYNVMISHRSGETEDTFISDLAVGSCAGQIKSGGCTRGERIAKYNRLLRIEDELTQSLLGH